MARRCEIATSPAPPSVARRSPILRSSPARAEASERRRVLRRQRGNLRQTAAPHADRQLGRCGSRRERHARAGRTPARPRPAFVQGHASGRQRHRSRSTRKLRIGGSDGAQATASSRLALVAGDLLPVRALIVFDRDLQAQTVAKRQSRQDVIQDLLGGHSEDSAACADLQLAGLVAVVALGDPLTFENDAVAVIRLLHHGKPRGTEASSWVG